MNLVVAFAVAGVALAAGATAVLAFRTARRWNVALWGADVARRSVRRRGKRARVRDVMFCFVDHYEPRWRRADYDTEVARVSRWIERYPEVCKGIVDSDGVPPRHTFFYPEEEYRHEHLERIADLCARGYGEIEVHLHHDRDTEEGLRQKLRGFVEVLHREHGALPVDPATGRPAWAFVHGNWALANSRPDGRWCGVNDELRILREEGCYADFTYPSAPDGTQPRLANRIYYASSHAHAPRAADTGQPVRVGGRTAGDLMIVQGPLGLNWETRRFGILPTLENADVRHGQPPTRARADHWVRTGVCVEGRPEWIFVKIHTHGTQDAEADILLGPPMRDVFKYLATRYADGIDSRLHFVSARETYNIIKAAEYGHDGDAGKYRDFLLPPPEFRSRASRIEASAH